MWMQIYRDVSVLACLETGSAKNFGVEATFERLLI